MRKYLVLILVLLALSVVACRCESVEEGNSAVLTSNGKIEGVGEPGFQFNMSPMSGMAVVSHEAITVEWVSEADGLVTKDKQPISVVFAVTVRRSMKAEDVEAIYREYRSIAESNGALKNEVLSRIPGAVRSVTPLYNLDQMLGSGDGNASETNARMEVTNEVFKMLEPELAEIYVELLDARLVTIDPDDEYMALLKQKAQADVAAEVAQRQTAQKEAELAREQAQTAIDIEQARRERQVKEEQATVYETSPQTLQLEMARIWASAISAGDVFFIPLDASGMNFFVNPGEGVVPVPVQ